MVPVVTTERLILRDHRVGDLDDVAATWGDPEVVRHVGGVPSTREDSWARMLRYRGHWELRGFGFWLVCERATGRYVGDVGIATFERTVEPPIVEPEAGWVLARRAHGRGYATEAVQAALAWMDAHHPSVRIACMIDVGNTASLRVAEKCGFEFARDVVYKGAQGRVFMRTRGA